jgi:solute carrier family 12 (sodium/potassium/chloride transporter), member 2
MTESPSANPGGSASGPRRYGTFEGVFVPTLLTILGAILFLRQGWVVGNAGFGGAVLIILTAFLITGATGLSLCSITTNIRIGAGGAYSIISRSSRPPRG